MSQNIGKLHFYFIGFVLFLSFFCFSSKGIAENNEIVSEERKSLLGGIIDRVSKKENLLPYLKLDRSANTNGIKETVLSELLGEDIRVPHTKQIDEDRNLKNLLSFEVENAEGATSILGHEITQVSDPHDDLSDALASLSANANVGNINLDDAQEIIDILLGTTEGRIYDGFSLLNFNRWNDLSIPDSAFPADAIKGEYKTKVIRDTGLQELNFLPAKTINLAGQDFNVGGGNVNIWEVDINMFWYGQHFDSDTFLIKVPLEVNGKTVSKNDTLRVNYHIYSLVKEDFAPTQVTLDSNPKEEFPGQASVSLPHKGGDSVWVEINRNKVAHLTVQHTALRFFRGVYTWGWRVHPPRIQFWDMLFEQINNHTGEAELDKRSLSMSFRNGELDIAGISDAAPEKKIYSIVKKAIEGTITAQELFAMLNDPNNGPKGTFVEWMELMKNQLQLPPEAEDMLKEENKNIADYNFVLAFMNNEMYGAGAFGNRIKDWKQGDVVSAKVINLDNHTHYYRNVDFGERLNEDLANTQVNGVFSFEIMNFKPTYGAPKVAEMQWRTGFGFKPHFSAIPQEGVFQPEDISGLKAYAAPVFEENEMAIHLGYQYSEENRRGDFAFNPPPQIVQSSAMKPIDTLYDLDRSLSTKALNMLEDDWDKFKNRYSRKINAGVVIGQNTEGFGIGKMCEEVGERFCAEDLNSFHPLNLKNFDTDDDGNNDEFRFPKFLVNPGEGGDIIPPTPAWRPFLFISPRNGTLFIDPDDPSKGHWVDLTYAHGTPVFAGSSIDANIEMPRRIGQVFYQFDDLFHDNDVFSPHPISAQN